MPNLDPSSRRSSPGSRWSFVASLAAVASPKRSVTPFPAGQPCRFLDDGRIDLDNDPVEHADPPRRASAADHLFAGSDGGGVRSATVCSLVATAKAQRRRTVCLPEDVLERMTSVTL